MGAALLTRAHKLTTLELEVWGWRAAHTLAVALRRTLMARVEGWAVVGLCVDGAAHALARAEGVIEDVLGVAANAARIVFEGECGSRRVVKAVVRASAGVVTAGQLVLPEGLRVVNTNERVCSVGAGCVFRAEFVVARGVGYMRAAQARARWSRVLAGYTVVDAHFSPVKRVSYKVSSAEDDRSCDRAQLVIETNGVDGAHAVVDACRELSRCFQLVGCSIARQLGVRA
ncbi:putative DNA-directed RNA polymerase, alpha subunit [Candidatus Hodgkinia cicadicola Dsem]|nr:putative DNA-directed RNA polymerase, alpha subunit [Candidatus Hodgkinia cicadicola Dsem]